MTCKCGSDRIARLHAKHSDMVTFHVHHMNFVTDGRVPYVNYVNGDQFLGGDYLNLVFCLDCGRLQNFVKIDDDEIDETLNDHSMNDKYHIDE